VRFFRRRGSEGELLVREAPVLQESDCVVLLESLRELAPCGVTGRFFMYLSAETLS